MTSLCGGLIDPLRNLQRHFVSNAVSNLKKLSDAVVNLSGQAVQRIGEVWTLENVGEEGIWA